MQPSTSLAPLLRKRFAFEQYPTSSTSDEAAWIEPGACRLFLGCPQVPFELREVRLFGARADHAALPDHRLVLRTLRVADLSPLTTNTTREIPIHAGGGRVTLPTPVTFSIAENILLSVENQGSEPLRASLALHGRIGGPGEAGREEILGVRVCEEAEPIRSFLVPPGLVRVPGRSASERVAPQRGWRRLLGLLGLKPKVTRIAASPSSTRPAPGEGRLWIVMRSPFLARICKVDIRSDSKLDLMLEDIRISNRSQLASSTSFPIEALENVELSFDTVRIAQDISILLRNLSDEPRKVEIDLEAFLVDPSPGAN